VYRYVDSPEPLSGTIVLLTDSAGRNHRTATNCAGNFFVSPADFDPEYTFWVTLRFGGVDVEMSSPIFRDGACATCHTNPRTVRSTGQVFFAPVREVMFPLDGCPP
jgi:hypothetical protein